ncbi:MAG: DUF2555 domain-containing protein [Cyanobacteria bacterium P01_C01_bin.120]
MSTLNEVSQESVFTMTLESVAELAKRLDQDAYGSAFEGLKDWHLLRAIAFQRPELVQNYTYLLDNEPFDEA